MLLENSIALLTARNTVSDMMHAIEHLDASWQSLGNVELKVIHSDQFVGQFVGTKTRRLKNRSS